MWGFTYTCTFIMYFLDFFHALPMMSMERYLGGSYLIFHRTSVTRRRLLTLLVILLILTTVMYIISRNILVISCRVFMMIFLVLFLPPFIFFDNFKLFTKNVEIYCLVGS